MFFFLLPSHPPLNVLEQATIEQCVVGPNHAAFLLEVRNESEAVQSPVPSRFLSQGNSRYGGLGSADPAARQAVLFPGFCAAVLLSPDVGFLWREGLPFLWADSRGRQDLITE